ncbi:hypothetical protein ACOKFD_07675 [Flagellimonas sp. S174]|uniref:hypothetical protein n=1 Tax=Flagellimonas sp. S174 TaxID=3410790 RepID=UPI003BF5950B
MNFLKDLHLFSALLGLLFLIALGLRYKVQRKFNRFFLALLLVFSSGLLLKVFFSFDVYTQNPKPWFYVMILAYLPGLLWYYLALDLKGVPKKINFDHVIGLIPLLYRIGIIIWITPKSVEEILQMRQYGWYEIYFYITCATVAFSNIWFFWVTWRKGYLTINRHFSKVFGLFTKITGLTLVFWCTALICALLFITYQYLFVYVMIETSFLIISLTIVFFAFSYIVNPDQFKFLWKFYDSKEFLELKEVFDKITVEMETNLLFKDSRLSLSMLSERIGVPSKKTSKAIKYFTQYAFPEYVNMFRIKNFITSVENGKSLHFDIWGLAQESGFGNKMSFYESFKKTTELTPGEFIKSSKPAISLNEDYKSIPA